MRTVKILENEFKVRPLKRKEVRQLREQGMDPAALMAAKADECLDAVFAMQFTADEIARIDELDHKDALMLWRAILAETYGDKDAEKNS